MTKNALNALVDHGAVDRLLARSRPILRLVKALIGKAPSPVAGDARLNTHFPGDRARTAPSAASNTIRVRLAWLCAVLGARHLASSTFGFSRTSLPWRIIPFLNQESPMKKSEY
jgi:hypothetical protein